MPNLKGGLRCKAAHKVKLYAAMLILQLACAGMYVLSSATLKDGMNQNMLTVYRNVFAAAAIAPFALYFERAIGATITVAGLYCLLWGKTKDHEKNLENEDDAVEMEQPDPSTIL